MEQYYYSTSTGQTYSASQMQALFGINVETIDLSILNGRGFYPVQPNSPEFDTKLYDSSFTWTLVSIPGGQGAEPTYAATAKPLSEAKQNGSIELKEKANQDTAQIVTLSYLSNEVLTSVASQDPLTRSPFLQSTLDEMDVVSVALGDNLASVDTATTVDEINNIVNPPTGIIQIYRTGTTLEESVYNEFSSFTLTAADTELYIPGSTTVISYDGLIPGFPQTPAAFSPGDFLIQIREVATSFVITEFECPEVETEISF